VIAALVVLAVACSPPERDAEAPAAGEEPAVSGGGSTEQPSPPPGERPPSAGETCEGRLVAARGRVERVSGEHAACAFNVDCVAVQVGSSCFSDCPIAVHPRGVVAARAVVAAIDGETCPAQAAAGCAAMHTECARSTPRCEEGRCAMRNGDPTVAEVAVPAENEARRADDPPPRPPPGELEQERGRRLLEAIVHDDPARAQDFFFPLEAFIPLKGIANAAEYWHRLFERYAVDIHALHATVPADAVFERLEVVTRGGWVRPREEGNRLPYWAARHNRLHYRTGGETRVLEVRVLITWADRWYITHLSEFH
jgi:hypothetical protein